MEKLSNILSLIGLINIGLGFILGAFLLHWVLGIIMAGIVILVLSAILMPNDN